MRRFWQLIVLVPVLITEMSQAQTSRSTAAYCNRTDSDAEHNLDGAGTDYDVASTNARPGRVMAGFEFLRNIGKGVIKEFDKAWRVSGNGTNGREGVVLIFRMTDGSYTGRSQGSTGEYQKFTFKWIFNAVAIVHTHPNGVDPRPSPQDQRVGEKYDVPIFTLTIRGMYLYNPATKITSKVMDGLDWLNLSRWTNGIARKLKRSRTQIAESSYKQIPADLSAGNINKTPSAQSGGYKR